MLHPRALASQSIFFPASLYGTCKMSSLFPTALSICEASMTQYSTCSCTNEVPLPVQSSKPICSILYGITRICLQHGTLELISGT